MNKRPLINIPENNNNAFLTARYNNNNTFKINKTRKVLDPMNVHGFPKIPYQNRRKINIESNPTPEKPWYSFLFESKKPVPEVLNPMNRRSFPSGRPDPRLKTITSGSTTYKYNLTSGGYRKKLKNRKTHKRHHTRK